MELELHIRRAQVYRLLAEAFLYPQADWLEDFPLATELAEQAGLLNNWQMPPIAWGYSLPELQAAHRLIFGLTGSLCYETEIGLPHEFRQSQELADIAGFYRAFGFQVGGNVRERPDHLAVELEFMYVLALKEAYALSNERAEQAQVCQEAQAKFLEDHLGKWVGLFADSLARLHSGVAGENGEQNPYLVLARFCAGFVAADAARQGVKPELNPLPSLQPTPFNPDFSCAGCPAAESLG
ncbi:MAG TPA: molecular chaperone TorD family protein [Anaerolineales bacterium]|nr:molecular chaperone TorD family protein [Anaerolineales bacterium]